MPIHDRVRDATEDVLQLYHTHTARAFASNCIEMGDDLHTSLLLEMRSAMTHMSKAVCCEDGTIAKRLEQLNDAKDHLIRASLDSYKIAYHERMEKLNNRYGILSKHNTLPQQIQQRYDAVVKRRKELSDAENTVITGVDTLEGYRSAYADAFELFDELVSQYPDRAVQIQNLKNILFDVKQWIFLAIGAVLGTVLGMFGTIYLNSVDARKPEAAVKNPASVISSVSKPEAPERENIEKPSPPADED